MATCLRLSSPCQPRRGTWNHASSAGADVNRQNVFGETALHQCVANGNVDAARLLLEHGADPNIQDIYGKAALHFAKHDFVLSTLTFCDC